MEVCTFYYGASQEKGVGVQAYSAELTGMQLSVSLPELASLSALGLPGQENGKLTYLLHDEKCAIFGVSYPEVPESSGYSRTAPCSIQYITPLADLRKEAARLGQALNFAEFRKPSGSRPSRMGFFPLRESGYVYHHAPEVLAALTDGFARAAFDNGGKILLVVLPSGREDDQTARFAAAEALDCLPEQLRTGIRLMTGLPVREGESDPLAAFDRAVKSGVNVLFCPGVFAGQIQAQRPCAVADMDHPGRAGTFAEAAALSRGNARMRAALEQAFADGVPGLEEMNAAAARLLRGERLETVQAVRKRLSESEEKRKETRQELEALRRELETRNREITRLSGENKELWRISHSRSGRIMRILLYIIPSFALGALTMGAFVYFSRRAPAADVVPTARPVPTAAVVRQEESPAPAQTEIILPTKTPARSAAPATAAPEQFGLISGDVVNLRFEPGSENVGIRMTLVRGTRVQILEAVENARHELWYHVKAGDIEGYVLAAYVNTDGS